MDTCCLLYRAVQSLSWALAEERERGLQTTKRARQRTLLRGEISSWRFGPVPNLRRVKVKLVAELLWGRQVMNLGRVARSCPERR